MTKTTRKVSQQKTAGSRTMYYDLLGAELKRLHYSTIKRLDQQYWPESGFKSRSVCGLLFVVGIVIYVIVQRYSSFCMAQQTKVLPFKTFLLCMRYPSDPPFMYPGDTRKHKYSVYPDQHMLLFCPF